MRPVSPTFNFVRIGARHWKLCRNSANSFYLNAPHSTCFSGASTLHETQFFHLIFCARIHWAASNTYFIIIIGDARRNEAIGGSCCCFFSHVCVCVGDARSMVNCNLFINKFIHFPFNIIYANFFAPRSTRALRKQNINWQISEQPTGDGEKKLPNLNKWKKARNWCWWCRPITLCASAANRMTSHTQHDAARSIENVKKCTNKFHEME